MQWGCERDKRISSEFRHKVLNSKVQSAAQCLLWLFSQSVWENLEWREVLDWMYYIAEEYPCLTFIQWQQQGIQMDWVSHWTGHNQWGVGIIQKQSISEEIGIIVLFKGNVCEISSSISDSFSSLHWILTWILIKYRIHLMPLVENSYQKVFSKDLKLNNLFFPHQVIFNFFLK
jgi:hypothetical protein